jgi:ABC-type phosphate transport system substrate-binding protein
MTIEELATEYLATLPGWVVDENQMVQIAVEAARYYAGYGDIASVSQSDVLLSAPGEGGTYPVVAEPEPGQRMALPIKNIELIDKDTEISTGEWSIIRPLFILYAERGNATMIEATRGLGVDVFGRSVSEIVQDITMMENETLPMKCYVHVLIEV